MGLFNVMSRDLHRQDFECANIDPLNVKKFALTQLENQKKNEKITARKHRINTNDHILMSC
uniref:Uncharacterized protein n=1 Tax=viral metagenome TaxID=1070528 RepID=A0A6C0C938_9ZZZZ